ncbi:acyltransferase family protein [Erysipelotrichaceae bacterium OttesenSCG-928-M19]|nr:acyltransferase family protein [Erysipelotrichaceae bacterium OttesenSCG-928-M19]
MKNIKNLSIMDKTTTTIEAKHFDYFDGLRVVCALLIVLLHSISINFTSNDLASDVWWFMNIANSFTRVGVTIFFMISGALLLRSPKNDSISYVFFNRVIKIFVQLAIFTLIYAYLYGVVINSKDYTFVTLIKGFLACTIEGKLWFLYVIIGLYLSTPLLRVLVTKAPRIYLWYFVGLSLLSVYLKYDLNTLLDISIKFEIPIALSYLGVYILGYLLNTTEIEKKYRYIIYILGILGIFFRIYTTYYFTSLEGALNIEWLKNYTFNVLFSSIALFLFAKNSNRFKQFSQFKIIKEISKLSLGIYLIHPAIIRLFIYWRAWHASSLEIYHVISLFLIVVVVTIIIVFILSKIKYISKLIT